jgi:hypothetical protein
MLPLISKPRENKAKINSMVKSYVLGLIFTGCAFAFGLFLKDTIYSGGNLWLTCGLGIACLTLFFLVVMLKRANRKYVIYAFRIYDNSIFFLR